jgi:hypothetical protein
LPLKHTAAKFDLLLLANERVTLGQGASH